MAKQWKILARHKWVSGATITESYNLSENRLTRFTATIRGWRNWLIFEGDITTINAQRIADKVCEIMDRIDSGDKSIFQEDVKITV